MSEPLDEDENQARRIAVRDLMCATPFIAGLQLSFDRYEPDDVTLRLPFREELTNDGIVFHGGVIASAIDTAGAGAAWSNHDFNRGLRAATVSLSIQYLGTAKRSDLVCHARARKRGRELIFTEITATDDSASIVAQAIQTYRIV